MARTKARAIPTRHYEHDSTRHRVANMIHANTLTEDTHDIQEKDRFDYILANPPFGGSEHAEVQRNFDIKTRETANLFMQHFMKKLRVGGEAAVVIKNTFLTNEPTGATGAIRRSLTENFNLHTILDLPGGVFAANSSTGVKTVVLFFWANQLKTFGTIS